MSESFKSRFHFRPLIEQSLPSGSSQLVFPVGVEVEAWVTDQNSKLRDIPWWYFGNGHEIKVHQGRYGSADKIIPELPRQQLELVTAIAANSQELQDSFDRLAQRLRSQADRYNLWPHFSSLPPNGVPADESLVKVYEKPRYQEIAQQIEPSILKYAWIAGVHVHVGMPSWDQAIGLYNSFRIYLPFLMALGMRDARRIRSYQTLMRLLNSEIFPPHIYSSEQFEMLALNQGFHEDPASCWWLMRLNPQGTVEMRFFDAQESFEHVVQLAAVVRMLASYLCAGDLMYIGTPMLEEQFWLAVEEPCLFQEQMEAYLGLLVDHAHKTGQVSERDAIRALMVRKGMNLGRLSQLN